MKNRFTSYQKCLEFLFSQLPMYQRIGKAAFKKDLTNTTALCEALDNPQNSFKSIHVAGTNGKGTVSHILAYALQQSGYKTGLYTSPHYKDFRERIKVDGALADKKYIIDFVNRNYDKILEIQPSFFEITVAMAFDYFRHKKVEYAIIEVGLGGRLDSTNIITPILSVITNISFDHMDMLGDTLEKIAGEKAGIIKPNVPVIIGEKQKETYKVFEQKAKQVGSKIQYAERLICHDVIYQNISKKSININSKSFGALNIKTTMLSPYHEKNLITAFGALNILNNLIKLNFGNIQKHFYKLPEIVNYIGRWQIISTKPLIIIDSAHNEAGLNFAMKTLQKYGYENIHFVIGFVKDKDLSKALNQFPKVSTYYFAKADIPRGLDAMELQSQAIKYDLKGKAYSTVKKAFHAAKKSANSNEIIYVGGSIFVAAEVL